MTLQSPEVLLESLNNALRHLRGACTDLGNEEIDDKLLEVMRRLLLAQVLGDTWVVAVGGSQGAGKTTLMACLYGLADVKSLTSDLRHDLDASAAGLHVFADGRGV
ncbi:hypothetical protein [Pseudomonas sp. CBZ-4]|uniref:hypothetical protein n=1 Tax=Pseudomonas sp. CBZ-4 TaxID=1163065 RepID=UPI00034C2376|nr:hypothetical protein [Pseudomonas sp. CBZ-4]